MAFKKKNTTQGTYTDNRYNNQMTITRKNFPTRELNQWLTNRNYWDHNDWLSLLSVLRTQGYAAWTESQEGRTQIGQYLETNRSR